MRLNRYNLRRRGTTLIELLVVIVIFLAGILAVVQIFPGGFKILTDRSDLAAATSLAGGEMNRLKARPDLLPEAILPIQYTALGAGVYRIDIDSNRDPEDLNFGSNVTAVNAAGNAEDAAANDLGKWQYQQGANVTRLVIGEGGLIPAPVGTPQIPVGSRRTLQFAPILVSPNYGFVPVGAAAPVPVLVYGPDMLRQLTAPPAGPVESYEYFLENAGSNAARISLPTYTTPIQYRLRLTYYQNSGGNVIPRDRILVLTIPAGTLGGYFSVNLSTFLGAGTFLGLSADSLQVARLFTDRTGAAFSADNPYEFRLLSPQVGTIEFNPVGYQYQEVRSDGRRSALVARVDYVVYDWRVLRTEFRIPTAAEKVQRLPIRNLKVGGQKEVDGSSFTGLGFTVPNGAGGFSNAADFALVDVETGGVYVYNPTNPADPAPPANSINDFYVNPTQSSYSVDKSQGIIRFFDFDRNDANGIQLLLALPGAPAPVVVNAEGRTVRALYMGRKEWSMQVYKASESYRFSVTAPVAQSAYVGGTAAAYGFAPVAGETPASATRIYFPNCDVRRQVVIDQIYYRRAGDTLPRVLEGVRIKLDRTDALGPYADIRDIDPLATTFDFTSYGYAVKGVRGASVNVRAMFNPEVIRLNLGTATNYQQVVDWTRTMRRSNNESFLQRGTN
ncbi:MAG: hypothetical protein JST35_12825 [Armatimonadetes bacterium]|nr:hypothetical protein [Armatimonadota bacterium]